MGKQAVSDLAGLAIPSKMNTRILPVESAVLLSEIYLKNTQAKNEKKKCARLIITAPLVNFKC